VTEAQGAELLAAIATLQTSLDALVVAVDWLFRVGCGLLTVLIVQAAKRT
jgi:hypothetical protein